MIYKHIVLTCLSMSILFASYVYAETGEFITIIGPDGFPMVVPHPGYTQGNSKPDPQQKNTQNLVHQDNINPSQSSQITPKPVTSSTQKKHWNIFKWGSKEQEKKIEHIVSRQPTSIQNNHQAIVAQPVLMPKPEEQALIKQNIGQMDDNTQQDTDTVQHDMKRTEAVQPMQKTISVPPSTASNVTPQIKVTTNKVEHALESPSKQVLSEDTQPQDMATDQVDATLPYQLIDGDKYYESEYLESKEFNLENKKRFYQIPTGVGEMANAAASWDVVEREKGVDMSWFNAQQKEESKQDVVVLGINYKVLKKDELTTALPLQCIDDKAKRKSKSFKKDGTLSLFPRAPLGDEFDYELVNLSQPAQSFKLTSFASSNKNPTYYWPVAIFLDDQGCIIEGASAFFAKSYPATVLQNESIEGAIQVPAHSKYIMLTALEQSVDIPERKLNNQGQIKLTVLR